MAKVLSRGDVVVCSVREVLSWFGVGRRGKRVVDRVMDAFERTHVVTTPPFDEAPIDGHVAIRLREGAKAGEYTVQRPH
jgi:predicted ThiF/HesA family dinucleotide-utilizing enzyme